MTNSSTTEAASAIKHFEELANCLSGAQDNSTAPTWKTIRSFTKEYTSCSNTNQVMELLLAAIHLDFLLFRRYRVGIFMRRHFDRMFGEGWQHLQVRWL